MKKRLRIAVDFPGGFITGGAMQAGMMSALADTGLLPQVVGYSTTSVGTFNAILGGILNDPRGLVKFWLGLRPQDVFRRRSIGELSGAQLAIIAAFIIEAGASHKRFARPFEKRFYERLRAHGAHRDSFNLFSIEDTIKKHFDLPEISRRVVASDIQFAFVTTNLSRAEIERHLAQEMDPDDIADYIFASASVPIFYPVRSIHGDLYCDGAWLKPDPLSFAYDFGADVILHFVAPERPVFKRQTHSINDIIAGVFEVNVQERIRREVRIANEKTSDVGKWKHFQEWAHKTITQTVSLREERAELQRRFAKEFRETKFSFRRDIPTRRIEVKPAWEPSITPSLWGGYPDFGLVPSLIERGYDATIDALKKANMI